MITMKPINWQWKTEPLGRPKNVAEVNKGKRNIKTDLYSVWEVNRQTCFVDSNQSILCHNSVSGTWGK